MDSPLISVRVVNVDWYLSEESRLPVVRIFGPTPAGQRACVHLHGALPYFMVRPMEDDYPAIGNHFEDPDRLNALLPQLEVAVESAMAASSGRAGAPSPAGGGAAAGRRWGQQRVLARLEVVRGVPFYGYHGEEKLFVKVYVNNPALAGKVASVLQAGHVLSTRFQPYESHVPFLLQVFIDYNISGMSYVHLKNALFLQPLPVLSSVPSSQRPTQDRAGVRNPMPVSGIFTSATVPESLVARPPGQSTIVRSPADASGTNFNAGRGKGVDKQSASREADQLILEGRNDEAARDLLSGISMSQLFSQPSSPAERAQFRPYREPSPKSTPSAGKSLSSAGGARKRPLLRWWERQTTTELEVTGTVDDVINPSLLAAGRAEAGAKTMAVASLRELWDEEKERSRVAGGGSQLSAPPGLELADSQDAWEPPEGLLTQDVRGAVEDLARNVLRRKPQDTASQPRSQASAGNAEKGPLSPQVDLTPSEDGLSQGSAVVACASSSPGIHFPPLDGSGGLDVDQGFLDILAALRGSHSQGNGDDDSQLSSPRGGRYTQPPSGPLSQEPFPTPTSSADQTEAIVATQEKQELEEEVLGTQMALAAHTEVHYDSDGSDDYHEAAGRTGMIADSVAAVSTPAAAPTTGAANTQTPPLGSQRAASFPPWSQRSAGVITSRAATLPFWSQRSGEAGGAKFPEGFDFSKHGTGTHDQDEEEEEKDEDENGADVLLSQLSSRSLDNLEDSVRAKINREGSLPMGSKSSPYDAVFTAQASSFEPSELVGILCSQIEIEQDQEHRETSVDDGMEVIMEGHEPNKEEEEEEEEQKEEDELDEVDIRAQARDDNPRGGRYDDEWTRGPIQLQYDDDGNIGEEDRNDPGMGHASATDVDNQTAEPGTSDPEKSGDSTPIRLRGGAGFPRTKAKPPRPSRSATAPEPRRDRPQSTVTGSSTDGDGITNRTVGVKRAAPPRGASSGVLAKHQMPRAPGGLRRSSSMPGGSFRPPRQAVAAADRAASGGGGSAGETAVAATESGDLGLVRREMPRGVAGDGSTDGGSETEEEESGREERSQVTVPGWGSQGHHPVEYSESQLSFVATAGLRASPILSRGVAEGAESEASGTHGSIASDSKRQRLFGDEGSSCDAGSALADMDLQDGTSGSVSVADGRKYSGEDGERTAFAHEGSQVEAPSLENDLSVSSFGEEGQAASLNVEVGAAAEAVRTDAERHSTEKGIATGAEVEIRWQGADARLRLAQARGSSPALSRLLQANSDGGKGQVEGGTGMSASTSRASPLVRQKSEMERTEGGRSPSGACGDSLDVHAMQQSAITTNKTPVGVPSAHFSPETPRRRPSQQEETGKLSKHVDTPNRGATADDPLVSGVFPTPTPPSPPALDWSRSPAAPLSAHSDQSDMPPLGQRSPALQIPMADSASSRARSSAEWENSHHGRGKASSPLNPRLLNTPGSGSVAGSPTTERLSGFTPPTPRPLRGVGTGTVVLFPRETAPDPTKSATALARLGVPQVVHMEPFYSRKDDVPERPREFAGKVFRIPHKDNLQDFDTLPSRELLHAYKRNKAASAAAAVSARATASSSRRQRRNRGISSSSRTPNSSVPDASWTSQSSGGRGDSGVSTTPPRGHSARRARGGGGYAGSSQDGEGSDGGSGANAPEGGRWQEAPVVFRGLQEWKQIAGEPRARRRERLLRQDPPRVVELVPAASPPSYKVVAAWGLANPSSLRTRRAVDDLDVPALRSTRNALGVLAGGGEADLMDGESEEMSMGIDANTGQLVPMATPNNTNVAVPPPPPVRPEAEVGTQPKGSPSPLETLNTPPPRTPGSVSSCVRAPNRHEDITPDTRNMPAKRSTQGPHRPPTRSQISPTTQTPSSCLSGVDGAGRFAFGLGAGRAAAATVAPAGNDSQGSCLGLSGGFVGRNSEAGGDRMTVLSLEIHVQVGANRRPDPRRDPVHAVCWRVKDSFTSAEREVVETSAGVIVLPSAMATRGSGGAKSFSSGGAATGAGGAGAAGGGSGNGAVCLKCGEARDDNARAFCTFEGGRFLGEGVGGAGSARGTFCHGLGKGVEVLEVCSEAQVMQALVGVFCRNDPDFVVGWEVQGDSLGYLVERGLNMDPSMDITRLLSRTPGRDADKRNARDEWGKTHGSGIWLTGRTVLNMWRLMRSELKLCSYTLQSVAEHVLRKRVPSFSLQLRSRWFSGRNVAARSRALAEPLSRAAVSLAIMDKLDLLGRTSEMARLFGIDFFSVLSRGSQYRVEAVMLRVLKPLNYVTVSPSRQQVASQAAMESIPLVFEPRSRFYTSPVIVLDFQSLYPSMMIAYNLCYSTALGKFDPKTGGTSGQLGVLPYPEAKTSAALAQAKEAHHAWQDKHRSASIQGSDQTTPSRRTPGVTASTKTATQEVFLSGGRSTQGSPYGSPPGRRSFTPTPEDARGRRSGARGWNPRCIHVAPNTAGFCHPSLRQGVLPLMLREILETRVMIKGAMKRAEQAGQKVLARTLNARQFALKMISNVTYGYTAAGFSGRMPMAELADAIVESGRQTLIAAARTVDSNETWRASVVYGDTDSLFIELPGRSLEEAHRIGREMAGTVSKSCPPDVVLKFEKVYLPCILASKKRYVGYMYESPKDLKPSFDAKGIETVRRDGCPLLVKMLEKVIRLLFTTKDLSQVKGYLYRQWTRILTDRAAVGDFIFAKEVRLGTYASDVYMPPSAIVASKAMASDPRAEPKYCERVPYVVVAGPVGARLMDLVVSPEQYLAEGSGLRLNAKYYITNVINPALDRALALLGVDVSTWYNDMPRPAPRVAPKTKSPMNSGAISGGGGGRGGAAAGGGRAKGGRGRRACVITNFFISDRCSLCGEQCARSVCGKCAREPAANCAALSRLRESDIASLQLLEMCRQCTGHAPSELFGTDSCGSLECPVFFERHRTMLKSQDARELCDALGLVST